MHNHGFVDPNSGMAYRDYSQLDIGEQIALLEAAYGKNSAAVKRAMSQEGADWVLFLGCELFSCGLSAVMPTSADVAKNAERHDRVPYFFATQDQASRTLPAPTKYV